MNLRFEKANRSTREIIFNWLNEPHMREFWDNTQEHKDDIENFIAGRMQTYFAGTTHYWIGFLDDQPFCFILSDEIKPEEDLPLLLRNHLSKNGHTICLDFGIGEKAFLGKGLADKTLIAFMDFYRLHVDNHADTFFIDPADNNPRARHVYEKAGFRLVGEYLPQKGAFIGDKTILMVKDF